MRGDFPTIGDVNHQGPHAIGAVIDADCKSWFVFLSHKSVLPNRCQDEGRRKENPGKRRGDF
jgi:hypothetical protein